VPGWKENLADKDKWSLSRQGSFDVNRG
jgi:hypothetical protein